MRCVLGSYDRMFCEIHCAAAYRGGYVPQRHKPTALVLAAYGPQRVATDLLSHSRMYGEFLRPTSFVTCQTVPCIARTRLLLQVYLSAPFLEGQVSVE